MKTYSISATYGSQNTPCTVFVYESPAGYWYVVEGGTVVNLTLMPPFGNVEDLEDVDCFTWSKPIQSLEELEIAVES